ncbi:MAG: L-histidine N(alpha)-methyltransferase [Acidimicrobiales bacterium]
MNPLNDVAIAPIVDVHLGPDDLALALRRDVGAGLTRQPKELPPKWLYDERGSDLFDQITRLDEYYPTEAEREILLRHAEVIIERAEAHTIVELGAGTSDKTTALLDAGRAHGSLVRFVPFDVSEEFLRATATNLAEAYPGLRVHGVVGDFDRHLSRIPQSEDRRMVVLLGGTIGNFAPSKRRAFLEAIVAGMRPGDRFLLGTDLVKEPARLELAYDDPQGITAAFTKNVLSVINRELEANFDLDQFDHEATWDDDEEWMDLGVRSRVDQRVRVAALDLDVDFAAGEYMRTEVSAKFHLAGLATELAEVGLTVEQFFTDEAGDFAVSLSVVH